MPGFQCMRECRSGLPWQIKAYGFIQKAVRMVHSAFTRQSFFFSETAHMILEWNHYHLSLPFNFFTSGFGHKATGPISILKRKLLSFDHSQMINIQLFLKKYSLKALLGGKQAKTKSQSADKDDHHSNTNCNSEKLEMILTFLFR